MRKTVVGSRAAKLGVLACTLACTLLAGASDASAARVSQEQMGLGYRLVDTWSGAAWHLTAGRYGHVADIGSAPDGTVYVLDARHDAIHVLAPDGAPLRVFTVPQLPDDVYAPSGRSIQRLDVATDGTILVLTRIPRGVLDDGAWFERLGQDGRRRSGLELERVYTDVAAGPDGSAYLSRTGPLRAPTPIAGQDQPRLPGGVDVLDAADRLQGRIEHPAVFHALSVDVDTDGTVYIVSRVPSPWDYDAPRPEPTELPSLLGRVAQDVPREAIEGVVVFDAHHAYRETVPFVTAEDVAAGPAGVFVSRNVEIFALGEATPLFSGPPGSLVVGFADGFVFHLDAPANGSLLAGMAHCSFQGVARFGDARARPSVPILVGELDRPDLEGPIAPLRLAVGQQVALLQSRYAVEGSHPDRSYTVGGPWSEPQSVQEWSLGGALRSQLGVCAGSTSDWMSDHTDAIWTRDVAADGRDVYSADPALVYVHHDGPFPAATFWPGSVYDVGVEPHITAIAADGGYAALLDVGAGRVVVIDRLGRHRYDWPLESHAGALPSDVALAGNRVYVADAGANRVQVHELDGTFLDEFATHDGPWRMDATEQGGVYVLGRRGWATHYDRNGLLLAGWPMPDATAEALDIAAAEDGRVLVAFQDRTPELGPDQSVTYRVARAGIWVFAPTETRNRPEVPPGDCLVNVDKWVDPESLRLGESADVQLDVHGWCPGTYDPVQLAILVDTSRSMNRHDVFSKARALVIELLAELDRSATEVALLTFDDAGALVQPLSRDHSQVARSVSSLNAWGDTRMASGLAAARSELLGPRYDPAADHIVLVVTDGEFKDDVSEAVRALYDDDIAMHAVVLPHGGLAGIPATFARLTGNAPLVNPDGAAIHDFGSRLARFRPASGLFERLTVTDVVPGNMRLVSGSDEPDASVSGDTLTWSWADPIAAGDELRLTYRLTPLETGLWPTNVSATADYRDVRGREASLPFPVPRVYVWDAASLTHRAYLPLTAANTCFRGKRSMDAVLVIDSSVSMGGAAADGGTKLGAATRAAAQFIDLLQLPTDRVAIVSFSAQAVRHSGLTGEEAVPLRALGELDVTPGTRIDLGLQAARDVLAADGRRSAQPVVVLLTDGLQSGAREPVIAVAEALRSAGVLAFAIALGDGADDDLLRSIATDAGDFLASPTTEDLADAYRQILERLACRMD